MALIGKIREKSWLLVAVIGIAMLAFILGDLEGVFGGGAQQDEYGIGVVDGQIIEEDRYNQVLNNARNQIFQNKMQQNNGEAVPLDENDEKNARTQAWNAVVSEITLERELEKAGIIVDDVELDNILFGEDDFAPSQAIAQAQMFIDSTTGEFSGNLVRQYIESLETSPDPQAPEQLRNTLEYVKDFRKEEKYSTLITAGVHATTVEAEDEYMAQKEVKNVAYTYQNFTKVGQDKIDEVTEEEIKTFYEKNKNKSEYKQEGSRKVSYFAVNVAPESEDTIRTMELLTNLIPKFKKAKNDSNFVMRFSDVKVYSEEPAVPQSEAQQGQPSVYPDNLADAIENGEVGDVVGPYVNREHLAISKIVDFVEKPLATVRHILINAQSDEEVALAQKKADSIVRVIRQKNNFEEMVEAFSEDPGSVDNGGKYEDFAEGMMVPEFNDFSFDKPIGSLGTVKTDFGIHIIEVLERNSPKRPILATINKQVDITKKSMDNANSIASSLIYDLDDEMSGKSMKEKIEIFDSVVKNEGYNIRSVQLKDENPTARGFGPQAEGRILRLAYEEGAEEGMLSSAPIRDGDRIIVAFLENIKEKGTPTFENVKDKMKSEVRKQKQAEYLTEIMLGREDLEALAQELNGQFKQEGLTFSANNTAVGREPILIGTAFSGLIDGQYTVPVKGKNGVFVLLVENTVEAPETTDFSTEMESIKSQRRNSLSQQYRTALNDQSEVIDNRKLRSYGIR